MPLEKIFLFQRFLALQEQEKMGSQAVGRFLGFYASRALIFDHKIFPSESPIFWTNITKKFP